LMKYMMKKKKVQSLSEMLKQAQDLGVKLVACSMSMEVMGIKKEELIDGVEIGGVATYLNEANSSGLNLFI
ncbi:MAG: DsrE/DsrF/DrsH-like family protein, partial [Anoxybacillus mongoliensis]|nr:DsrE/DsrF/DrsH-like family protein [Anoxybacillus mongoliensis]